MIITRTPYRISFFGGGTDYPSWYLEHGGAVLATTINKYCYLTCRFLPPFFEHRFRVVYSKIEGCNEIDEIQHPAVRAILHFLKVNRGVEIHHDGDLPARSGMGSSSAFTVGLLNAMHALHGRMAGKEQLKEESLQLEQEILKETVGSQDQVLAAFGGFNHVSFHQSGQISVRPVILPVSRLQELSAHLMLFYTGIKRTAASVASTYVGTLEQKRRHLRVLRNMVEEALEVLCGNASITSFGELLHEAWLTKRSLGERISSPEIDDLYEMARFEGAVGGKITGAGGGGFLLLFVPPNYQARVRERLNHLIHVPFDFQSTGSQVIFYDREADYAAIEAENRIRPIAAFRESDATENESAARVKFA